MCWEVTNMEKVSCHVLKCVAESWHWSEWLYSSLAWTRNLSRVMLYTYNIIWAYSVLWYVIHKYESMMSVWCYVYIVYTHNIKCLVLCFMCYVIHIIWSSRVGCVLMVPGSGPVHVMSRPHWTGHINYGSTLSFFGVRSCEDHLYTSLCTERLLW